MVGPNAAGKSTLLKCIAGLLPVRGRILLGGQEVRSTEQRRALRQQVTYLPPRSTPSTAALTVFEAVLVARQQTAAWIVGDAELGQVAAILEDLRLDHLALRYLNELSGGQRQMVAVAQALARDPRVLLLDEPTSSLDLQRQLELLELVRKLASGRRMTVLIALHDLNLAARFADRLVMLHGGTVYADGTPGRDTHRACALARLRRGGARGARRRGHRACDPTALGPRSGGARGDGIAAGGARGVSGPRAEHVGSEPCTDLSF